MGLERCSGLLREIRFEIKCFRFELVFQAKRNQVIYVSRQCANRQRAPQNGRWRFYKFVILLTDQIGIGFQKCVVGQNDRGVRDRFPRSFIVTKPKVVGLSAGGTVRLGIAAAVDWWRD